MKISTANVTRLAIAGLTCLLFVGQEAHGQGYLDKLESIVKQLGNDASAKPNQAEELPPPAQSKTSTDNNASTANPRGAQTTTPGGIYLGLEAENVAGGGLGVHVTALTADSPAWKAGIQKGDRIMAVSGFAVANLEEFAEQLYKHRPGQTVRFLVTRGSRNIELPTVLMSARLAQDIEQRAATTNIELAPRQREPAWFGIKVNDLTGAFRRQFGQEVSRGAAVVNVSTGSPARRAGIKAGDCIVEFASRPIGSASDLTRELADQYAGAVVEVIFYRGRTRMRETVTLSAQPGSSAKVARPSIGTPSSAPHVPSPSAGPPANVPPSDELPAPAAGGPAVTLPPMLELPLQGNDGSGSGNPITEPAPRNGTQPSGQTQDSRVTQLEREVAQLRKELAEKNKKIDDMERRLRSILESLGGAR